MILDVFNKNKKSDYEVYIYEGDVIYKKASELDNEKKYYKQKSYLKKQGNLIMQHIMQQLNPKIKMKHIKNISRLNQCFMQWIIDHC